MATFSRKQLETVVLLLCGFGEGSRRRRVTMAGRLDAGCGRHRASLIKTDSLDRSAVEPRSLQPAPACSMVCSPVPVSLNRLRLWHRLLTGRLSNTVTPNANGRYRRKCLVAIRQISRAKQKLRIGRRPKPYTHRIFASFIRQKTAANRKAKKEKAEHNMQIAAMHGFR